MARAVRCQDVSAFTSDPLNKEQIAAYKHVGRKQLAHLVAAAAQLAAQHEEPAQALAVSPRRGTEAGRVRHKRESVCVCVYVCVCVCVLT
jgi:hypothetical protein